jgi:hypothetical protein
VNVAGHPSILEVLAGDADDFFIFALERETGGRLVVSRFAPLRIIH